MDKLEQSVQVALGSGEPIPRELVREWIQRADHVEADALLNKLTDEAWNRIEPPLEGQETCALIQRYLLRCIRENPQGGVALNRYEAAGVLEAWFDHLASTEDGPARLQAVVLAVTDLFLDADDLVRRAIETGFLEHVLEQPTLRPYFSHWALDDRLQDAWQECLAWGEAHPNFMKNLRVALREAGADDE
jgi:hypothetical protein